LMRAWVGPDFLKKENIGVPLEADARKMTHHKNPAAEQGGGVLTHGGHLLTIRPPQGLCAPISTPT